VQQYKFAETNKMVPMDPLRLITFFEQCQAANKVASVLDKIKEKKQDQGEKTAKRKEDGSSSGRLQL
jgi:hypothetical protein